MTNEPFLSLLPLLFFIFPSFISENMNKEVNRDTTEIIIWKKMRHFSVGSLLRSDHCLRNNLLITLRLRGRGLTSLPETSQTIIIVKGQNG